jgi:hypothetical protein
MEIDCFGENDRKHRFMAQAPRAGRLMTAATRHFDFRSGRTYVKGLVERALGRLAFV